MTKDEARADINRHVLVHTSATEAQITRRIPLTSRCRMFEQYRHIAGALTRRRRKWRRR